MQPSHRKSIKYLLLNSYVLGKNWDCPFLCLSELWRLNHQKIFFTLDPSPYHPLWYISLHLVDFYGKCCKYGIDCLGSVEVVPKDLAWETKKQLQRLTEIPSTTDRHWTVTVTVYKRRNSRKTKPALPTGFENCFHMNISSLQVFILSVMLKISSSIGNGRKHICLLSNLPSGRFVYWIYDSEFCLESARIQTPKITLAFFKRGSTFSVHG